MVKHTPGEWKIELDRSHNPMVGTAECTVAEVLDDCHPDVEQQEANARLIAAAPDMLAALKSLVGRDLTFLDSKVMGGQITYTSVKAARAAIARAEGGDQ